MQCHAGTFIFSHNLSEKGFCLRFASVNVINIKMLLFFSLLPRADSPVLAGMKTEIA